MTDAPNVEPLTAAQAAIACSWTTKIRPDRVEAEAITALSLIATGRHVVLPADRVAALEKERDHYKAGANMLIRRLYRLRDGLHQIRRDYEGMSPHQMAQFAALVLSKEPESDELEAAAIAKEGGR